MPEPITPGGVLPQTSPQMGNANLNQQNTSFVNTVEDVPPPPASFPGAQSPSQNNQINANQPKESSVSQPTQPTNINLTPREQVLDTSPAFPGSKPSEAAVHKEPSLEQAPAAPPGKPSGFLDKLPLKYVFAALGALAFVGIASFLIWKFVFDKPKPPEEISLTMWGVWEDEAAMKALINEYQIQNSGVKITYSKQSKQDYRERLANNLARGGGPDIFTYHNTWVPMFASQLAPLPATILDASQYQSTYYPATMKDLNGSNGLVGMPLMTDGLGLYINEEIFSNANKAAPTTWDELRLLAQELTVKDENGSILQGGVALGRIENVDHWEDILSLLLLQGAADLSNPTGKLVEVPIKYYTVFNSEDHVWDETLPSSTQAFASGKLAMYFGPSWRVRDIKQLNPNLKFKVVPVPQLPKTGAMEPDINFTSYWAAGVWSKSKNTEASWKFLRFITGKEQLQKLHIARAATNSIGLPYPRGDMAGIIESDPYLGAFVKEAPTARSSYLASNTFDGATGLNTRISGYFASVLEHVIKENKDPAEFLPQAAQGIRQVLLEYNAK